MRTLSIVFSSVLFLAAHASCHGADGFLLTYKDGRHSVVKVEGDRFRDVASLGGATTYGQSATSIGLVSHEGKDRSRFTLIDKATSRVLRSWPVDGLPVAQLSGPSPDVVLTDRSAYFATVQFAAGENIPVQNAAGGRFGLRKLSLASGEIVTIPLPAEGLNPRFVNANGAAFIYSWNGTHVWKYDDNTDSLMLIASPNDFDDSFLISPDGSFGNTESVRSFADFVILPDAGIFRLSRRSTLQPVLVKGFGAEDSQAGEVDLGQGARVRRIYGGTAAGRPVIGALRDTKDGLVLSLVRPAGATPIGSISLSSGAVVASVLFAGDSVLYVDGATSSVLQASPSSTKRLWDLKPLGSGVDMNEARILAVLP